MPTASLIAPLTKPDGVYMFINTMVDMERV